MEAVLLFLTFVVLPYLAMSFICMVVLELIEAVVNNRGRILRKMITNMLGSIEDTMTFYNHPYIQSVTFTTMPGYISTRAFSLVVLDMHRRVESGPLQVTLTERVQKALNYALIGRELEALGEWYIDAMDQAAGKYRRWVTLLLFVLAFALVVPLNLDAIRITTFTLEHRAYTETDNAGSPANSSAESMPKPSPVPLSAAPIGWSGEVIPLMQPENVLSWYGWLYMKLVGLFVSIFAIVAGAPLLFDVLNKYMVIRSTIKPYEGGPVEPSSSD